FEGVRERGANLLFHLRGAIQGHGSAQISGKRPHIVETEEMVRVVVREGDRVDDFDLGPQELQSELRRRVDQEIASRQLNAGGAAVAMIPWIGRIAHRATATDNRNTRAGSRAQENEPSRHRLVRSVESLNCSKLPRGQI